jgi:hypothetical protein
MVRTPARNATNPRTARIVSAGVLRQRNAAWQKASHKEKNMKTPLILSAALSALLSAAAANAADYTIAPMKDGDTFIGCLAQNTAAGLGYLAVGDKLALFANTDTFKIAKGDHIRGTWSVDGGTATEFSATADTDNTATIDVPNASESVIALTTGKEISVTANGTEAKLSLDGTEEAFTGLMACMQAQGAE